MTPIEMRPTPVKVMCLLWSTSLQTPVRATSRRWETNCFTFLWAITIWKLGPCFWDQLINLMIAHPFHPCVRLPSPSFCFSGTFWPILLLTACLLELITVALVPQQFSFYSTKPSWNTLALDTSLQSSRSHLQRLTNVFDEYLIHATTSNSS